MANTILVGAQWGDEGKGKIIDVLTKGADVVVRTQGGNNAGHTVFIGRQKYVLHLVPSGILRRGKTCVIGNGVVVDPVDLVEEIKGLRKLGVTVDGNLFLSETAHVVFPYHRELDAQREVIKGLNKIGTTKRGIGPAYGDKAARTGLRVIDLVTPEKFKRQLEAKIKENNSILRALGAKPLSFKEVHRAYRAAGDYLKPFVANTVVLLHEAMDRGKDILFEGAQGTFLDIDHGTYPFVTSSSATAGGAATGTGVGPTAIGTVISVTKAYVTRVGEGPFPTEIHGEVGEHLRARGHEYGAVTGRPRRCGWLDIPLLRYSNQVNGAEWLVITKMDVMDELEEIPICIGYELDGKVTDEIPADVQGLERIKPRYTTLKGWRTSTEGITEFEKLPQAAQDYLRFQERESGAKIGMVSTGPDREQTMSLPEFATALDQIHG